MSEFDEEPGGEWVHYEDFARERYQEFQQFEEMLDHFDIPGPGPPGFGFPPKPPEFVLPPPPVPGEPEECQQYSLHFDACDNTKTATSEASPEIHIMSVIVLVCCLIILVTCCTVFIIWRRRRSKSRLQHLLQYPRSSGLTASSQFYDDLLDTFPHSTSRNNPYLVDKTLANRNQMNLTTFLLYSPADTEETVTHPIYEEIYQGDVVSRPFIAPSCAPDSDYQLGVRAGSDYQMAHTSDYHTMQTIVGDHDDLVEERRLFLVEPNATTSSRRHHPHLPHQGQQQRQLVDNGRPFLSLWRGRGPGAAARGHADRGLLTLEPDAMQLVKRSATSAEAPPRLMPNPDDILPQQAWTDLSGSDRWPELDNRPRQRPKRQQATTPSQGAPSPGGHSPSDVTMSGGSNTSSESYPECQFQSSECSSEPTSR